MGEHQNDAAVVEGIAVVQPADAAALAAMQNYYASALPRVQTKAEKWIPGLAAIAGVLTTAVVVKGPEDFTKLAGSWTVLKLHVTTQAIIITAMVVGAICLGISVLLAYRAAFGNPMGSSEMQELAKAQQAGGAYAAWTGAVGKVIKSASRCLKVATVLSVIGTLALLLAVIVTWITPTKASPDTSTCITTSAGRVKIDGAAPKVTEGQLTVVPC